MHVTDALIRAYLPEMKETLLPDREVNEVSLLAHLPMSLDKFAEFKNVTTEDPVIKVLQDTVLDGWPSTKVELPADVRPYRTNWEEISCIDGLLFKGHKHIVPHALRPQKLEKIHESHQGIVKYKQGAHDVLFWPGMSTQI